MRYYVELPIAFGDAEAALFRSPETLFRELADVAHARGEWLLSDLGFEFAGRRLAKRVSVELSEPIRFGTGITLPMSWQAIGRDALFPSVEADLEIAPLGKTSTQLAISARYTPPLGVLGRALDRALLHRLAEAAIKDFLDHVASALTDGGTQAATLDRRVMLPVMP